MANNGFKRTPSTEYGSVKRTNAAARQARPAPATPPPQRVIEGAAPGQAPSLNEIEQAVFGASRLPGQPITAGAPVGPGTMGTVRLSDREAATAVVRRLAERPDAPAEVGELLAKLERGV